MDWLVRFVGELPLVRRLEPRLVRLFGGGSLAEDDAVAGLVRFAAMGLVSTVAYFAAALAFLHSGITPTRASILAMLVGLVVSFRVQSRVTFRRTGFHPQDAIRFGVLGASGLVLAHYAVVVVHQELGQPAWYAAAAVSLLVPLVNFIVMNFWVFVQR